MTDDSCVTVQLPTFSYSSYSHMVNHWSTTVYGRSAPYLANADHLGELSTLRLLRTRSCGSPNAHTGCHVSVATGANMMLSKKLLLAHSERKNPSHHAMWLRSLCSHLGMPRKMNCLLGNPYCPGSLRQSKIPR